MAYEKISHRQEVQKHPEMVKSGSGLCYGPKASAGKGKRLMISHIGGKQGFVKDALLCFERKKTSDYHEEMNGEVL